MMKTAKPYIQVDERNEVYDPFPIASDFHKAWRVNWSPPFEGVPSLPHDIPVEDFLKAYSDFRTLIESSEFAERFTVRRRIEEGDIVCFANNRYTVLSRLRPLI